VKVGEKRADLEELEYQRQFEEFTKEDDGVTGYIEVRPEELEGAPWEIRKKSAEPNADIKPKIEKE
jgi:hypothetical protein